MSRLSACIVDSYPDLRESPFQFDSPMLGAFFGAELGFQNSIDLDGEAGFGQFEEAAGHLESVVVGGSALEYSESGSIGKTVRKPPGKD